MSREDNMKARIYSYVGSTAASTIASRHREQYARSQQVQQQLPSSFPDNGQETNLIYWLRGIPYPATERDLVAFLAPVPAYHRVDLGVLQSGECSGNAFVELSTVAYQAQMEQLHKTEFPCATYQSMPDDRRPRPRYVEVIPTTAQHRAEQLQEDANLTRAQAAARQQEKKMQADDADAPTPTAGAGVSLTGFASSVVSLPQPQTTLADSEHASLTSAQLPALQPQPQLKSPQCFLIPTNSPVQQPHMATSGSSFQDAMNSFSSSQRSVVHMSAQSSPQFGEPMSPSQSLRLPVLNAPSPQHLQHPQPPVPAPHPQPQQLSPQQQQQQQQQQQHGCPPYNTAPPFSHMYPPQRPFQ